MTYTHKTQQHQTKLSYRTYVPVKMIVRSSVQILYLQGVRKYQKKVYPVRFFSKTGTV